MPSDDPFTYHRDTIKEIENLLDNEAYDELRARLPCILIEYEKSVARDICRRIEQSDRAGDQDAE